jgi:prolipoprotein diacylglyceryltransferase
LGTTMGQWLSVPLLMGGAYLAWLAMRRPPADS